MDCFGYHDERERACAHCWVNRQCKSFRTTHGEEIEASVMKATLEAMTEEEVGASPYLQILIDFESPAGRRRVGLNALGQPVSSAPAVPMKPLPHLD